MSFPISVGKWREMLANILATRVQVPLIYFNGSFLLLYHVDCKVKYTVPPSDFMLEKHQT